MSELAQEKRDILEDVLDVGERDERDEYIAQEVERVGEPLVDDEDVGVLEFLFALLQAAVLAQAAFEAS